uniref:Prenylated flavin chaperone LpdD-like domain-containing protein n=1 Tax=Ammonifex degensii TaxID=42838 RepID=A0A7C1F3U9_9THEO
MVRTLRVSAGTGKFRVDVLATLTGEGVIVHILGGEKPHVGAVVLSVPRPSRSEHGRLRANTTVVPLYGHRDDEIARPAAEKIATACAQPTVVVAGLHIEAATGEEVEMLVAHAAQAVDELVQLIAGESSK